MGLGIEPVWNPPRQPWLNPRVERLNSVTQQWVETATCPDHATLEERLAWACRLQREWYPAVAGQTRLQAHPDLTRVLRPYSVQTEASLWVLDRVDAFLASGSWRRHADRYGTIWLYNRRHCLGRAHAGQDVLVRSGAGTRHWVVHDGEDQPLMRFIAAELSRERIMELSVSHHRPPRKKKTGPETYQ